MRSTLSLSVERLRVVVRIDGVDVSRANGDGGVDPWHVLVPVNRFVAGSEPSTVVIACCPSCGPDCSAVEARIRRDGDAVHWAWGHRRAVFEATAYRERPDDSAAAIREILAGPVARWHAAWHPIRADQDRPHVYAGSSWRRAVVVAG